MADIRKVKRTALAAFLVMSAVILYQLYQLGKTIYFVWIVGESELAFSMSGFLGLLIPSLIVMTALTLSLLLLHAIRREETPFNLRNVKQLKAVALMFILFEPCMYLVQRIYFHYNATMLVITDQHGNESISSGFFVIMQGGIILAIGLIIYCIALVFQYGIALQMQADETL